MKINEIFFSIQGEGKYAGKPQVFIRMQGCNLRCRWCDTPRALGEGGMEMAVSEVMCEVKKHNCKSVCITGGEPMIQLDELRQLVKELKKQDYEIVLETNGSFYDREIFGQVGCVSMDAKPPSSGEKSDLRIIEKLKKKDQLKVIIADRKDYEFAKKIGPCRADIILQPAHGTDAKKLCGWVLEDNLDVRVIPQLHKIIGVE